jgi:hypothetical protein
MPIRPSVLCPIDFSDPSRGALRYGAAIAEHFYAGFTVLAVTDRFLAHAANARTANVESSSAPNESSNSSLGLNFPAASLRGTAQARRMERRNNITRGW